MLLVLLALFTTVLAIPGQSADRVTAYYDEAIAPDGSYRGPFARAQARTKHWGFDFLQPTPWLAKDLLNSPLGDQIKIHPVPMILSSEDHDLLERGSAQRALALQAYFKDLVLGRAETFKNTSLPSPQLIERILAEEGLGSLSQLRHLWRNHTEDDIHFLYGPDIIRTADGSFRVLEDNVGYIGGFGDLGNIHLAMTVDYVEDSAPGYPHALGLVNQRNQILGQFLMQAHARDSRHRGGLILYRHANHMNDASGTRDLEGEKDQENDRVAADLYNFLIQDAEGVVTQGTAQELIDSMLATSILLPKELDELLNPKEKPDQPRLSVATMNRERTRDFSENVCAYLDSCTLWEGRHPIEHAEQRWLRNQFENNGAQLFYAPGTEFLGHKALLPYVDSLVRYFHKTEPLIKTAPTRILPDLIKRHSLDQDAKALWDSTQYSRQSPKVVKVAAGTQGWGVHILPQMRPAQRRQVYRKLAMQMRQAAGLYRAPPLVVVQDYFQPSRLGNFAIDYRPIWFSSAKEQVSGFSVPWGRAQEIRANVQTKTNVSQGARELAIFQEAELENPEKWPLRRTKDLVPVAYQLEPNDCASTLEALEPNPSKESANQSSATHPSLRR